MFQYASDDSYEQIEGKTVNKEKTKIEKTVLAINNIPMLNIPFETLFP